MSTQDSDKLDGERCSAAVIERHVERHWIIQLILAAVFGGDTDPKSVFRTVVQTERGTELESDDLRSAEEAKRIADEINAQRDRTSVEEIAQRYRLRRVPEGEQSGPARGWIMEGLVEGRRVRRPHQREACGTQTGELFEFVTWFASPIIWLLGLLGKMIEMIARRTRRPSE